MIDIADSGDGVVPLDIGMGKGGVNWAVLLYFAYNLSYATFSHSNAHHL